MRNPKTSFAQVHILDFEKITALLSRLLFIPLLY